MLSLSVIMPALNEGESIAYAVTETLDAFQYYNINGEIIVINDGSRDSTCKIVENMMSEHQNLRLISHESTRGIGYSFFHGVRESNKDTVVMFPGDNENDPKSALAFLDLMNRVDIIVPFICNTEVRSLYRRSLSFIYKAIINLSFGVNFNYTNGTVFYRKDILKDIELRSNGFLYQTELLIKLTRKNYLFAEVPNLLKANKNKSKAIRVLPFLSLVFNYFRLLIYIHIQYPAEKKYAENKK